jgi:hypothetical protein
MPDIAHQHCLNHPLREAVARCPECRQFYCRECVTEHDDRVICASCLHQITKAEKTVGGRLDWAKRVVACGAGWLVAGLFFYGVGRELIALPSEFHDEAIWRLPITGGE